MVGAFLAFGTHGSLAILAVLSYRLISFWLPTIPGAAAYLQLRRTVGVLEGRDENSASQSLHHGVRGPARGEPPLLSSTGNRVSPANNLPCSRTCRAGYVQTPC